MNKPALLAICALMIIIKEGYGTEDKKNLCPEITGCSCQKSTNEWTLYDEALLCYSATDPPLHLLTRPNIERILFSNCIFLNASALYGMKRTQAKRVSFLKNRFPNEEKFLFDWDWLPDTTSNISFVDNNIQGFRNGNLTGGECDLTRFSGKFELFIDQEDFSVIPSCVPETTVLMNLKRWPENTTQEDMKWPKDLRLMKISEGGFGNISVDFFKNAPDSLAKLWISRQNFADNSWTMKLPAKSLTKLIVTHSKLYEVKNNAFENFHEANSLTTLWLSYNDLKDIPNNLPASLLSLRMDNNMISYVTEKHWSVMKNLKILDLSHNRLVKVPLNMPTTLESVHLYDNRIAFSDPEAFSSMKNLTSLSLSNNRLTALPKGIEPGIKTYQVSKNHISLVNGPEEYDFCVECISFQLFGNPWYCNLEMLKMLSWLVLHNVGVSDPGVEANQAKQMTRCSKVGLQGIDGSWLQVVIKFMEYFDQPPNDKCLYDVETLRCQNAELKEVPQEIPPSLYQLYITDNPKLKEILAFNFFNQTELWKLDLRNNSFSHVPFGLPLSLRELDLRYNSLGDWNEQDLHAFSNLTFLRNLYLEDNNIKVLYGWQFENLVNLKWIGLAGNPLHCDCALESFTIWFAMRFPKSRLAIAAYPTCATPESRNAMDIRQLRGYYSYEAKCAPEGCLLSEKPILNCSKAAMTLESNIYKQTDVSGKPVKIPASTYWTTLYLNGLELRSDQILYVNLTRLRHIDLSHNLIKEIPLAGLPPSIRFLNLSFNEIATLPSHKDMAKFVPNIEVLDLSNNNIQIINFQVNNLELIGNLYLQGNPFLCNCSLRPFIEWLRVNKENNAIIERHQLQSLTCHLRRKSSGVYSILDISEAEYCPEMPIVAIVCSVVALVLLILVIIIIVYVVHQKKRRAEVSEKILLGFRGLLEKEKEEESDPETGILVGRDYRFDAFVSYDPNGLDAEFVISLLEELEDKLGYKLCLNERDFIPGTGITDNIVECIGASKHVILVLSRSFVSSPWCQYEVQVALAELHQRRKSRLLISILLEDVSVDEDLASSVKTFLSLVPAIKVPGFMPDEGKQWKEFWENLVKLMSQPINITEV